jgi:hypothetical protein
VEYDPKLVAAMFAEAAENEILHKPKHEGLLSVWESYIQNLDRINASRLFPEALILNSLITQFCNDQASIEVFNRLRFSEEISELSPEDEARFVAVANQHLTRCNMIWEAASRDQRIELVLANMTRFLAHSNFVKGFEAHLASLTINSWTAFEALATDLWVAAVNMRPMSLGIAALESATVIKEARVIDDSTGKKKPNPISLDILKKYKFDLSNSMGTMLWREDRVKLGSLESISDSYKCTFCFKDKKNDQWQCPKQVEAWFEGKDYGWLRGLEQTRHVLVHRGGLADKPFLESAKDKHPAFSNIEENDRIPLDGELIRDFMIASIRRGKILLEGVDQWLNRPD